MANKVNINMPKLSDLTLQVKLEGDWETVTHIVEGLGDSMQRGYDIATVKFANQLLSIIRRSLNSGTPPVGGGVSWLPLAESTIKRWGDHPIYHLTGLYAQSVGMFRYKSRTLVGLPIGTRRASNKQLTLNQLAIILENGTRDGRIPARPVWAPSLKAVGGRGKLKASIITEIRKKLISLGIKPNQVKW